MVSPRLVTAIKEIAVWTLVIAVGLVAEVKLVAPARAAVAGQTTLYFHKEPSDANETYNALLPTPAEPGADTASGTTSTTVYNSASPALCESTNNTGETFNQVSASAASTGERCIASFISPPVGQTINMTAADGNLTIDLYTQESSSQATSTPKAYVYKLSGGAFTPIATFSGTDPGTAITHFAGTATPATVAFTPTDRVVIVLTQNVTKSHTGTTVSNYFDNNSRTPSANFNMKYTVITPNPPTLAGANDDAFTTAQATTSCAGNPTFNTKWTCLAPTAANTAGHFNDANTANPPPSGDSSGWLWLRNSCGSGTVACTPSNFGTTPSNTFLYQTLSPYGDGTVRTAVESSLTYTVGATNPATPYNHAGLVLWTSNTDYLEVQVYSDAAKGAANTAKVALFNNSGIVGSAVSLNPAVPSSVYNRVWLGFSNTGGSYQAQYSTDGTTWNSVGSPVTHANFGRVGLNAFSAVGISTSVTNYAGGFNYFSYGFGPPGPTVQQRMRDGKWWLSGVQQNYWLN